MAVIIKKPKEIEEIKKPAKIVGQTLKLLRENAKPGVTPLELDKMAEDFIRSKNARPAFKGLYDFPNAVCISKNGVVIHGIPDNEPLKEGDVVGFDVGAELNGWYGDAAITVGIGKIKEEYQRMIDAAKGALYHAIENIKPGMRYKQISKLIEDYITSHGYVPLKGYSGHGIGRKPHEEPQILNYVEGKPNQGEKVKNGHVFCLEPMLCHKAGEPVLGENGWDVYCEDMEVGVHYEHQVAIVDNKAIILTEEN
ncbi:MULTISPECIES: type I methionyl aminopeptidase [unclassified Lebetimonas]|uniref:type I methionyl aminopeptidase n=1 Tax=unclassified Lebetimonas TaxID=2648158 RepID=UPI000463F43C|nr:MULTISPECIES: type I methionyl aminopeptidase [unclassified Lebetimonas]